jgi:hypothetical protein
MLAAAALGTSSEIFSVHVVINMLVETWRFTVSVFVEDTFIFGIGDCDGKLGSLRCCCWRVE